MANPIVNMIYHDAKKCSEKSIEISFTEWFMANSYEIREAAKAGNRKITFYLPRKFYDFNQIDFHNFVFNYFDGTFNIELKYGYDIDLTLRW